MLNPNQIAIYRPRIAAGTHQPNEDGWSFSSAPIRIDLSATKTESVNGTMYSADAIFGTPAVPDCLNGVANYEVCTPIASLQELRQARVIGNAAFIDSAGQLYAPDPVCGPRAAAETLERNGYDHDGYVLDRDADGLRATFISRPTPRRYRKTALFVHNLEPGNFGSFIFRQLPQLLALDELRPSFDCYVVPDRTHFFKEALRLLDLPDKPIFTVAEVCGDEFDAMLSVNSLDIGGFIPAAIHQRLREWVTQIVAGDSSSRPTSIYVSRALTAIGNPGYRQLVNETEVTARILSRGYDLVYPETLSLVEQIRTFARAARIIGPSGSGMLNCVFAAPGARVLDMESYAGTVGQHAMIYASSGHRYAFLFGAIEHHDALPLMMRRWRVDGADLERGLDWLDADARDSTSA